MLLRLPYKIILPIVVLAYLAFQLCPPLFLRMQLDGYAHDAADSAASALVNGDADSAKAAATQDVSLHRGVTMTAFAVTGHTVEVTLETDAKSYFSRFGSLKGWFHVTSTASQTHL